MVCIDSFYVEKFGCRRQKMLLVLWESSLCSSSVLGAHVKYIENIVAFLFELLLLGRGASEM